MLKKLFNRFKGPMAYALLHQLTMAAYGFGLLLVLIRIMPQYEVGRWLLFISAISISDMIMHGLLQTVVVKESAGNPGSTAESGKILNNAAFLAVSLYLILVGVGFLMHTICCFFYKPITVISDFTSWYPLFGVFMVIYNLSWWINTGRENFKRIFIQRLIFCCSSCLVILILYFVQPKISFESAVISQVVGFSISSANAYFSNGFLFRLKFLDKEKLKSYLDYGKYTCATMLGSSLLRNADTFMIAALLNTKAVAIYVVAQKIIEIFEILLRSVAANLFLILYHLKNDSLLFIKKLLRVGSQITLLFIPAAIFIIIFANQIIDTISSSDAYSISSAILRIFMVYVLLLPADRLIGMTLEIYNKPHLNMIKTFLLITVNITGNFIALYYFHSLKAVAAVSSLALITGIISGLYFMRSFGMVRFIQFRQILLNHSLN
jgi:O-antigen/teichoic acid export membrane protein